MHKYTEVYAVFESGELLKIMQRNNTHWSAVELSNKTDFPMYLVEGLLRGTRGLTKENAVFLAKILGIDFFELFGDVFVE